MLFRTVAIFTLLVSACSPNKKAKTSEEFLLKANKTVKEETYYLSMAEWVHSNFITQDTTKIASDYNARYTTAVTTLALDSKNYSGKSEEEKRMLSQLLKVLTVPAPQDAQKNRELAQMKSELESMYGSGKFCEKDGQCQSLEELNKVMAHSQNPDDLLKAWDGWRTVSQPMKGKFQKAVELSNEGAKELGYKDLADLWRSKYDMPAEDFEKELDRLWGEVKPFYDQLHCYVRSKLNKKYGDNVVPLDKAIPAHLLGNMWAQAWDNVEPLVNASPSPSIDITELLKKANYDSEKMVKTAENFFVSLGMPQLPESFYKLSLFDKPKDREVVCHASAWHIDLEDDVRIKMCIESDEESFRTIHHELGHIYYYLAYKDLPAIFQGSANDGFHEALGDTIELSITSDYLKKVKLLDVDSKDVDAKNALLKMALGKVAFLPFGLMIDKWRWQVFDERTPPEKYNEDWWKLREQYQGVRAPNERPTEAFDPGAKYHIPAFTPYSRYFLAHILQFQLHRSLCQTAGFEGPLHECSIFNSKEAGAKLWKMMNLGISKNWQDALKEVTGTEAMDATALRDYFAPLEKWLVEQNKGMKCGWDKPTT